MAARHGLIGHGYTSRDGVGLDRLRLRFVEMLRGLAGQRSDRQARPRLGMIGAPLGIVAALMLGWFPLVVPLAAGAWWWAPREWGWEWLVAVGRGVLATEWAYMGAGALAAFPGARLTVAGVWVAMPLALAVYRAVRGRG